MILAEKHRKRLAALIERRTLVAVAAAAGLAPATVRVAVTGAGCHVRTIDRIEALLHELDAEVSA